jgi:hypothetical protein
MKEKAFRKYLRRRKTNAKDIDYFVGVVRELEEHLKNKRISFDYVDLDAIKEYISLLITESKNTEDRLVAIARYFYFAKKTDLFIYFTSIMNAVNVLPDVDERLTNIAGEKAHHEIFNGFELPPLGSPPDEYPKLTKMILDRMEARLPAETCREVLTWNYHKIPIEAFNEQKSRFEKAASIDEYLKGEHERLVNELERFMKEGRPWFEQEITPEVLEYVKNNQEICTGVRKGNKIYVTKIPYAPRQYFQEKEKNLKKYHACHCQLVRSALRDGNLRIPPTFCYCSSGFEKLHFDAIFGESVSVELLETLLKGDDRCRFAIEIPKGKDK